VGELINILVDVCYLVIDFCEKVYIYVIYMQQLGVAILLLFIACLLFFSVLAQYKNDSASFTTAITFAAVVTIIGAIALLIVGSISIGLVL
jgi:hypothetical protein